MVEQGVDQFRRQRVVGAERAAVDQLLDDLRRQLARVGDPGHELAGSACRGAHRAARGWGPKARCRSGSRTPTCTRRAAAPPCGCPGSRAARAPAAPGRRSPSGRPAPRAAARSSRTPRRCSSPRCPRLSSPKVSASATANLPAARKRRTASRSSCATAKPCSVSASRTRIPATRGSLAAASRAITTSVTVGGGRNWRSSRSGTPAVSLRLWRQSAVKKDAAGQLVHRRELSAKRRCRRPRAPAARARRSWQESRPGGVEGGASAQAALGSRRCRRLSVRSWPQAARMSRPARRAHRRGVARLLDDPREGVDAVVGRAGVGRARPGIERDQVDLGRDVLRAGGRARARRRRCR